MQIRPVSPILHNENVVLKQSYNTSEYVGKWNNHFSIDIKKEFNGIDEFYLYEGKTSGLAFFYPFSITGSENLYKELHKLPWYHLENKWEFNEAIMDLANCNKILEVGSGHGFFIEKIQKRKKTVLGIESNEKAVWRTQKKGLNVKNISLETLINNGEKFDAVCSFQVLEHVSDVQVFLNNMISLVKPGGLLIVSVPNSESFIRQQENLLDMPPHHMSRWKESVFRFIPSCYNIDLLEIKKSPLEPYHVQWYTGIQFNKVKHKIPGSRYLLPLLKKHLILPMLEKQYIRSKIVGHDLYALFKKSQSLTSKQLPSQR